MDLIVDIEKLKFVSVNEKYISRKYVLSQKYRDFMNSVGLNCKAHVGNRKFDPMRKYSLQIEMKTALDLDNCIKPILDSISRVIDVDDRNFMHLNILKATGKRGELGTLRVYISEISY